MNSDATRSKPRANSHGRFAINPVRAGGEDYAGNNVQPVESKPMDQAYPTICDCHIRYSRSKLTSDNVMLFDDLRQRRAG